MQLLFEPIKLVRVQDVVYHILNMLPKVLGQGVDLPVFCLNLGHLRLLIALVGEVACLRLVYLNNLVLD